MKRMWVVGLVVVLVAAGCGTRVKEQTMAVGNGGLGGGAGAGAGTGTGGGGAGTAGSGSGGGSATGSANMFGSIENPCGPNTTGAALPATEQGVTATEIDVSTIADPGGAKPGLNQGMFDSMKAFADWCNSFGGINGRKLVVSFKDAQLVKYKDVVLEACQESFALVGGLGTLDQLGAQDAVDCGLVNVPGAVVSAEAAGADYTYQALPNLPNKYATGSGHWVKDTYPDAVTKASSLYSKFTVTENQSNKQIEAYEQFGFKFIYKQSANINETNWAPLVVSMKNQGVKYMTLVSSFEEIVPLQKEMASQNYHPEVTELETNFYNAKYPQLAKEQGADTTNTFVHLTTWPFEEADKNPAMKLYLELLKKSVPDAQPEELGVQSFSAGLYFATAAKAAGANLTRQTLMTELAKVHNWTGGGLHGVSDPGNSVPTTCFIEMKVVGGDNPGFVRVFPLPDKDKDIYDKGNGWSCPEGTTATVNGNYGTGAKAKK